MKNERKHYTAEEKVAILRRHLLDKVPVSELCEEKGIRPTVFYRWQKEFFENGAAAFEAKAHWLFSNRPPTFDTSTTRRSPRTSCRSLLSHTDCPTLGFRYLKRSLPDQIPPLPDKCGPRLRLDRDGMYAK
jgi:transposase-like protein